jgi:hypothetical protein
VNCAICHQGVFKPLYGERAVASAESGMHTSSMSNNFACARPARLAAYNAQFAVKTRLLAVQCPCDVPLHRLASS